MAMHFFLWFELHALMCLRQMECDAERLLRARNLFFFLLSIEPSFIFVGRVHFHFASSSIERASAAREEIDRRSWPLARSHHNQTPAEATEREKIILSLSFSGWSNVYLHQKGFNTLLRQRAHSRRKHLTQTQRQSNLAIKAYLSPHYYTPFQSCKWQLTTFIRFT